MGVVENGFNHRDRIAWMNYSELKRQGLKTTVFAFIALLLMSCATSEVGGTLRTTNIDGSRSQTLDVVCYGQCKAFNANGSCVTFTADIANICTPFFVNAAAINGDCNPLIINNNGLININYRGGC
jgi:hypothetical protein